MPRIREYRRIDFGTDMIAEALRLCIADVIRLDVPDAELDHVRMAEGEEVEDEAVVIARWRRAGGLWRDCAMDAEEITAVLIGWCRIQGVPLPRAAEKAIESAADGVSLVIRQKGLARAGGLH